MTGAGGPESGHHYCQSAACGTTDIGDGAWHCVANVYDGVFIRAYVDGRLDNHTAVSPSRNPFKSVKSLLSHVCAHMHARTHTHTHASTDAHTTHAHTRAFPKNHTSEALTS